MKKVLHQNLSLTFVKTRKFPELRYLQPVYLMYGERSISGLPRICSHDLQPTAISKRGRLMQVLSSYHIYFARYKNFNESQVNVLLIYTL